jgi:hypothetical protein
MRLTLRLAELKRELRETPGDSGDIEVAAA